MNKYNDALVEKCKIVNWQKTIERKGYKYFTNGAYNLNIIGVRSKEQDNEFNDVIVVEYWNRYGDKYCNIYPATTDPGYKTLINPVNVKGTAILVPGQYRSCFKKGKHKGQYEALVQYRPVKVYRDDNKDTKLNFNPDTIEEGMFGINIHKAGLESVVVDGWSAGCQVIARSVDFNEFMNLVILAIPRCGDIFTYTLIEEKDLVI